MQLSQLLLPAGHENFVRIEPSAGALSADVPDSDKKNLCALRAFAAQSLSPKNVMALEKL